MICAQDKDEIQMFGIGSQKLVALLLIASPPSCEALSRFEE